MGSLSDWWSKATTATPSAAPEPTVIPTGAVLKTGTVLNSKDDPVVFTKNDDGTTTGQNESTLPAAEPATFGEAFAENLAAGNETFIFNGKLITTELAPDDVRVVGDTLLTGSGADTKVYDPRGDQIVSPTGTGINADVALTEDDLMSQEVVGAAGQEYADSLPAFSYDFTADDTPTGITSTLSGRNLDDDLGIGVSEATVTAADLLNDDIASDNITTYSTPGGGGVTLSDDNARAIDQIISGDRTASDLLGANIDLDAPKTGVMGVATDANGDKIPGLFQMKYDDGTVSEPGSVFEIDKLRRESLGETTPEPEPVDLSFGSPLPGDNVVADASGYANYTPEQFVAEAGPTAVDIVAAATPAATTETGPFVDAFGTAYATQEEAAQADVDMNNAAVMANNPDFEAQFPGDVPEGMMTNVDTSGIVSAVDPALDLVKSFAVGVPSNAADMFGGIEAYAKSAPYESTNYPILTGVQELYSRMNPEKTQEAILSADPALTEGRSTVQGAGAVKSGLQSAADYLTERFFPEGRDQAVVTGTTPSELAVETVSGEGGGTGLAGTVAEEVGGGVIDILGSVNLPARLASAGLNIGEQLSGTEATTREALTQLVNSGALADNERYQKVLADQGGDVEKAITAITRANTYSTAPQTAGTGVFDAAVPKFAKGFLGTAKDLAVRSQIEGGQEVAESAIALSGLNNILNLPEDRALQPLKDASGNYVMGALTGAGTSIVASPVVNAIGSKTDSDNAAPTPDPSVLDPSKSRTAGQPAQSSVPSSYDEAGISGASDTMRSEIAPDKLTVAEELMMNQLEDEGAIDLNQLRDLDLTLFEMQSAADSAITKKMDADANMLQFVAEQEAIDNNGRISAELVDEIQTKLSPELAAEVIETASNAPYVDASGQSRMDIFLNNQAPSSLPSAPTEGIAPKVDTTSAGAASIAKAPASGIETVVAKSPDDIIAEQRAAQPVDNERIQTVLSNAQKQLDAGSMQLVSKTGAQSLVDAGLLNQEDTLANPLVLAKVKELLDAGPDAVTQMLADNANKSSVTVVEKDGDSKTTRKTGAAVTETDTGATVELTPEQEVQAVEELYQKADAEIDNATDVKAVEELYQKADAEIDNATDVKAVEELYQKADAEIDALTDTDTAAATDTSTDTTTDTKVLTEVGEFPEPEVEVEEEVEVEVDPDDDVTVELDEDDTFVEPITFTDENGDTVTECPEGYVMVEGPDGSMCEKSVEKVRQRAGISTRAYTGLAGNRGRVGSGQRRRTSTSTRRVRPTSRRS